MAERENDPVLQFIIKRTGTDLQSKGKWLNARDWLKIHTQNSILSPGSKIFLSESVSEVSNSLGVYSMLERITFTKWCTFFFYDPLERKNERCGTTSVSGFTR